MFCFAVLMNRDGMVELAKYALVYGILSLLNLLFDLLPLALALSGRAETEVTDFVTDSPTTQSFTVTATSHPFFDRSQGLKYNALSLAMISSPCAMLLGGYLAASAHNEIQRTSSAFFDDDVGAAGDALAARQMITAYGSLARAHPQRDPAAPQNQLQRFTGTAHKLDA